MISSISSFQHTKPNQKKKQTNKLVSKKNTAAKMNAPISLKARVRTEARALCTRTSCPTGRVVLSGCEREQRQNNAQH